MAQKKKKPIAAWAVVYLVLTTGLYMFLNIYANSYNALSEEKITPASMNLSGDRACVTVLEHSMDFSIAWLMPDSRFYLAAYILSPDELRSAAYLISFRDNA